MATYVVVQYSSLPPKSVSSSSPSSPTVRRRLQPSPEKRPYSSVAVLPVEDLDQTKDGSPRSKRERLALCHEFTLGKDPMPFALLNATAIELSFPMVVEGEAVGPIKKSEWAEVTSLFETTYEAWMTTPFLIICVRTLPPRPWPFTIGRVPLFLTIDSPVEPMDSGRPPLSSEAVLTGHNLRERDTYSHEIMSDIVAYFKSLKVVVHEVMSFEGFLRIVVSDDTDLTILPRRIAHQAARYKLFSEEHIPDPSALSQNVPHGVIQDNTNYLTDGNSLLRPGIMLSSSSLPNGQWLSTTSGILVVDKSGIPFITAATHGFNPDGEVWHPDPNGAMIGKIVHSIPGADLSIIRLSQGIRYVNQTFGTSTVPEGLTTNGFSLGEPPNLRRWDEIMMNNPFSGFMEGIVLALGVKIEGNGDMIKHQWVYMNCSLEPVAGSCGSPILDLERKVVGFFRYKEKDSNHCYCVSSMELREADYEICGQEREF